MGSMNEQEKIEYNKMLKETSKPLSSHAVLAEVRADMLIRAMNLIENYRPDEECWLENYYELEAEVSEHFS
jgi:hypothetical protein